jgi:hypothetical protein
MHMQLNFAIPLTLHKNISNEKAQTDFIFEQQEHKIKSLVAEIHQQKEKLIELDQDRQLMLQKNHQMMAICNDHY